MTLTGPDVSHHQGVLYAGWKFLAVVNNDPAD